MTSPEQPPVPRDGKPPPAATPAGTGTQRLVRRVALLGNVNVGKTSLFDQLCGAGDHAVNIPGSTLKATRGVLTVGDHAAPRSFRRACESCSHRGLGRRRRWRGQPGACCAAGGEENLCPALRAPRGWWPGRERAAGGAGVSAGTRDGTSSPVVTHLFDTPGSTTLVATSEDEMVARDLLLSGLLDAVVLVADAKNLRRSLALALEVASFDLPLVLDLNMLDEAEAMGIEVDDDELAARLGVPVVRTIAVEGHGVRRLADRLPGRRAPDALVSYPEAVEKGLAEIQALMPPLDVPARAVGLLLMAGDRGGRAWLERHVDQQIVSGVQEVIEEVRGHFGTPLDVVLADAVYAAAGRMAGSVATSSLTSPSPLVRLGRGAQRPFPGVLIAGAVLVAAYYWIGAFGASFVVDRVFAPLFDRLLIPLCDRAVAPIPWAIVRDAIMDRDFGLLPTGLFLALGIVLPVLFCFYLFQAVLEDSGYLPRLSVLLDRAMRTIGLNGQGLIPLVLGFSCVTMAVITTRMLPSRRERILLTFLLMLGIPCAPLLAVMFVILDDLPWTAGATVFGVIALQTAAVGYAASRLLPGERPDLILEIPPMRVPRPRVLLRKTWRRTWQFMREAVPIFLIASLAVFFVDRAGGLTLVEHLSRPLVHGLLGLPDEAVQVFIKTGIRRENGATELNLLRDRFDHLQMVVTMLVMVFLVPCINSVIVVFKERGLKVGAVIFGAVITVALVLGTSVNWICRGLGIDFM